MALDRTLRDAIYGLAVGDAFGVPYEFKQRGTFHAEGTMESGTRHIPAGTFSDDTSMTLATCDSLRVHNGKIKPDDMLMRFRGWRNNGAYAVNHFAFDIGITTANALSEGKGCDGFYDNGNGSLMRIIPLAFVPNVKDKDIETVSAITHAHEISKRGCVIYVRFAQDLLSGTSIKDAIAKLKADEPYNRLTEVPHLPLEEIDSDGFVVSSLEAALWALSHTDNYADCILTAVNMGFDTDTTAAIAGGCAGIVYGFDAIPTEWIETLRGKDIIETVISSSTQDVYKKLLK
ncbi:MAG: ADP-ribosylglycohydrolase family protein [Eggerthellaceae bacterium]